MFFQNSLYFRYNTGHWDSTLLQCIYWSSCQEQKTLWFKGSNFKTFQNISSFLLLFLNLPVFCLILLGILQSQLSNILSVLFGNITLIIGLCFLISAEKWGIKYYFYKCHAPQVTCPIVSCLNLQS